MDEPNRSFRFARVYALAAALLLLHAFPAHASLSKDQQKCINEVNKNLAKLAKAQGKEICRCMKDGSKGKLTTLTIEQCTTADRKGKVAKREGKAALKILARCTNPLPPFVSTDASVISAAAISKEILLIHDIFGSNLDEAILDSDLDKVGAKCQLAVAKAVKKCQDAKLKAFNKCKKDVLRGRRTGGGPAIETATELQAFCMESIRPAVPGLGISDPGFKMFNVCDNKLEAKINKKCKARGVAQAVAFRGVCFDAPDLQACLDRLVECRVCLLLDEVDGLARDCDLFDDGQANDSCPPVSPACGDGTLQALLGEQCDDGNNSDGDGCNALCQDEF